jgi:hypothetical protein
MAKFKIKDEMVQPLKNAGYITAEDILTIRIPHREQGSIETMFELQLDISEAIETDNRRAIAALRASRSPRLQVGGNWVAGDPTVLWFDELPEEDMTTTKLPHVHGEEVLTLNQRKLLNAYKKKTGNSIPRSVKKSDVASHLANAYAFFAAE